jgi:uncharacterized repeat protein (TIGR01451 family)
MVFMSRYFLQIGFLVFVVTTPVSVWAAEILLNNSFELPLAPANGNNFYTTIPNWTLLPSPVVPQPANIVVPTAAYADNPTATPVGGGRQYFDMNSVGGTLQQSVVLSSSGAVAISCWFSVRDFVQNLTGMTVRLKNSTGTIVASASTSFTTADPIGLWKQAKITGVVLPAGNYTFEILMDNFNNIDIASLVFAPVSPSLSITKTSDKAGPVVVGDTITYTYVVSNVGNVGVGNLNVNDVHNGLGVAPVPGSETLFSDSIPIGDSTDAAANNGVWTTIMPGDSVKFLSTYLVTQSDIDYRQ